jgi:Spy/CpxP family protein refolding chaperone
MKIRSIFLSFLAAGILSAQPAQHRGWQFQNLTADLNLTADQQTQVRSIFQGQAAQTKALAQQARDQRVALEAAIKSGATDQIDKITQDGAQLQAQMAANRAKNLAKFYSVLTPDQKAKVDPKIDAMFQHAGRRKN